MAESSTERERLVRAPRYPGEDTRVTSKKELAGWYSFCWAAEVFVACGMGAFIPLTLEQLAREQGVLLSDRTTPCAPKDIQTSPSQLKFLFSRDDSSPLPDHSAQCVVNLFGTYVNTTSFAMYTFSIGVLVQALVIISMSGAADHGRYRKSLLVIFACIGSVATMLFIFVTSNVYFLGGLLAIIANTGFGASSVLLNSFLSILTLFHPDVNPKTNSDNHETVISHNDRRPNLDEAHDTITGDDADSTTLLLDSDDVRETSKPIDDANVTSPRLQVSTQISSRGIGLGLAAAFIVQILSVLIVVITKGSTFSFKLVLFFVGAWWFVFTIPAALWLRPRPGPPLRFKANNRRFNWLIYLGYSWTSLGRTIMRARQLKDLVLFLVAWFLLSDGIATISSTSILFAKTTLEMKPAALVLIDVVVMVSGVAGALGWNVISRWFGLKPIQTVLVCLCLLELIPLYMLLAFIPQIKRLGFLGLQQAWEIYPLGVLTGFVLGGISPYCRSLFGELIPPGFEAAFYALYSVTDKGSSIFGPAIVGAITDATGDIRRGFVFLAVLLALPIPILFFVDVKRGKLEAASLAKELENHRSRDDIEIHD